MAGEDRPNWLYVETGVDGLVSWELGFGVGFALVRRLWKVGVD